MDAVLGAAGFIGASLVSRLVDEGRDVEGWDVKETPWRAPLYEKGQFFMGDLREYECARLAMEGCERVFHLAADHGGAGYFHGPADYKAAENNLLIDQNVRRAARECGVQRIFFAGSACSYPIAIQGEGARPLRESDFGGAPAEACYGEAKRMSTLMFEASRNHGLDARSAIFSTIYGPGQDFEEPRAKFPTALSRKLVENPERVEIWGDGTQVRTFLYIEDALDRIQAVMEGPYVGPVNIGSDEEVTVQQCAEWAAEAAGADPEWVYTDGPTGVAHRSSDNSLWNQRYGEEQLVSAKEGFAKTYAWVSRVVPVAHR